LSADLSFRLAWRCPAGGVLPSPGGRVPAGRRSMRMRRAAAGRPSRGRGQVLTW